MIRLTSGDASAPERVAEETEALVQANVDFEVVAGVKTALAATAGQNSAR